jgi:hypothetical protein
MKERDGMGEPNQDTINISIYNNVTINLPYATNRE